jgi:hypothetical protein
LLSKIIEKMQGVGCLRGPANEEKEPQSLLVAALSLFACNSSLIAGTIAEDDYKDNDGVEDGMKVRDSLLGRQGVAESSSAWYESAFEAERTTTSEFCAALRKGVACLRQKMSTSRESRMLPPQRGSRTTLPDLLRKFK